MLIQLSATWYHYEN